ncbi:hypothetical protein L1887_56028 [Cichorium endivia]|nr:hypothetical protein L1887_56028 [Cichorium endivia]
MHEPAKLSGLHGGAAALACARASHYSLGGGAPGFGAAWLAILVKVQSEALRWGPRRVAVFNKPQTTLLTNEGDNPLPSRRCRRVDRRHPRRAARLLHQMQCTNSRSSFPLMLARVCTLVLQTPLSAGAPPSEAELKPHTDATT